MSSWKKETTIFALFILLATTLFSINKPTKASHTLETQPQRGGVGISITIEGGGASSVPQLDQPSQKGGGGPGVSAIPAPATVVLKGFSYPEALVTFLKNGATIGNTLSDKNGVFEKTIETDPGISTFGIWGKDKLGINSQTTNITISLISGTKTTVSNVVLSPTISADKNAVTQGKKITIFGSATPKSDVRIFNNYSPGQLLAPIKAEENGHWEYVLETLELQAGEYSLKVNSQLEVLGLISAFSSDVLFNVERKSCFGSDLNNDGKIDTADFSILMFYWNKPLPKTRDVSVNSCVDTDDDGFVSLADFSVMMYKWTG